MSLDKRQAGVNTGRAIEFACACLIGCVCWWCTLVVFKGGHPPRRVGGAFATAVFLSPIAGLVIPSIVRNVVAKNGLSVLWRVALAPLAGCMNYVVCVVAMLLIGPLFGYGRRLPFVVVAFFCLVWVVPLARSVFWSDKPPSRDVPVDP
ncbi:hypothetical protein [Variovorax rhizosphaerae]|uniref:Transmembrane protein n=1 Tax=Variovorax rhizosphaerae TaxID=1836200 RepID=A0ABU8WXD5_9BURK